MDDLISRKMAIDSVDSETVITNPEHFKSSEKFIKFMDDDDIASFGEWQWANGFNTALVATGIRLKKLPSAQPERILYANMSDAEFEKWLYEHGICNPNIHESIPCDAVPLLIDNAISELQSTQSHWTPCNEKKPETMPKTNEDVLLQFSSNMGVGFYQDGWAVNTGEGIYTAVDMSEENQSHGCHSRSHTEVRVMGKFEVITPIGAIEVMADEMQIIISDLRFIRNGHEVARFNGEKIFGWIDRTGESE